MLEIGQFFKKDNAEYGLLDKISYNGGRYFFFSIEKDGKVDFAFYTVDSYDDLNGYDFKRVEDKDLLNKLFEIKENNKR